MYVGDFFELDRSFAGDRVLVVSTEEEAVIIGGYFFCEEFDIFCIFYDTPDLIWYESKCFEYS